MKAVAPEPMHWDLKRNPPEFSLVLGGPLYQLLRRAHLSDDALMMVRRRVFVAVLVTWFRCCFCRPPNGICPVATLFRFCATWKYTSVSSSRCRC